MADEIHKSPYHMVPITDKNGTMDHYHMVRTIEAHTGKPMDPAKQHALKKIAFGGHRGHKDELKDVREAIATLEVYAAWIEQYGKKREALANIPDFTMMDD